MITMILEDTRQQERKHEKKHDYFRHVGIHWNRTALYCGDYTLPADQSVCVDTKKDIQELIGDIQVKAMAKKDIKQKVFEIANDNHIGFDVAERIYHAICDDDTNRFAEKEINDLCFQNNIPERAVSDFQKLYVKRHGFFHRGLKRAQNSGIRLVVLVENNDGVACIDDLIWWINPRLKIMRRSNECIGFYKNGKPRYKRVQKFPNAATGEQLAKSLITMHEKYGVEFMFCSKGESGKKILELLGIEV